MLSKTDLSVVKSKTRPLCRVFLYQAGSKSGIERSLQRVKGSFVTFSVSLQFPENNLIVNSLHTL